MAAGVQSDKPRPLAVGIIDDITPFPDAAGAGGHYAVLYALNSKPCGEITSEDRQHAVECL